MFFNQIIDLNADSLAAQDNTSTYPYIYMGESNSDEKILSYNDVVLRRSDEDILSGPHFLNDRIIEFYFSHLSSSYPCQDVLLVPPAISFWIMHCPVIDSLKDFVEPLDLPAKKLILFPVNDNEDVSEAEGGSHWSLLVFHRDANAFVHHDSCRGLNTRNAKRLYNVVFKLVSGLGSLSDANYLECPDSPQQMNGYDCGLYVSAIARVVCVWHKGGGNRHGNGDGLWFSEVKEKVTPWAVSAMRKEMLGLIQGLIMVN